MCKDLFGVHNNRGVKAMNALGVLPHCLCWLIHDFWKPYLKYDACFQAAIGNPFMPTLPESGKTT